MRRYLGALLLMLYSLGACAYSVENGKLYDDQGQAVQLRGVNWFGFETTNYTVHGLWARNWRDMIVQMQGLGFNAVRLPFCPTTLRGVTPSSIDYGLNPELAGLNSLQLLDTVVQEFSSRGFYVLLDHHRPDCQAISELWYTGSYSEQQWIDDLKFVAQRYAQVPGVIGLDLKNEPHGAATWGTGSTSTDWDLAVERAAAAVMPLAPHWLMFVEGIGENPVCSSTSGHWWGGNLEPLACTPLDIPDNRLVLAPHAYGPDVYVQPYFNDPTFPDNMPAIWELHFGQFVQQGYAVMLGEFGGKYGEGDPRDVPWQDSLVDYLISKGVSSGFYWSWNPNSGDTGGILRDDWISVRDDKLALLERLWTADGSTPVPDPDPDPNPDPDPDPVPDPTPDPQPVSLPASTSVSSDWGSGYCLDATVTNTTGNTVIWTTALAVDGSIYTLWNAVASGSSGTVSFTGVDWNAELPAGASASFGYCANRDTVPADPPADPDDGDALQTSMVIDNDWGSGYCAQVSVTNIGTQTLDWAVTLSVDGVVNNAWNVVWSQSGSDFSASGVSWNNLLEPQASANFGFCAVR